MDQETKQFLENFANQINKRMDKLESHMDSMEHHMDSMERRMDGMDSRMDGMDSRMDRMENQIKGLAAGQHELYLITVGLREKVQIMDGKLDQLNTTTASVDMVNGLRKDMVTNLRRMSDDLAQAQ
jgi:archaellum component FlaC